MWEWSSSSEKQLKPCGIEYIIRLTRPESPRHKSTKKAWMSRESVQFSGCFSSSLQPVNLSPNIFMHFTTTKNMLSNQHCLSWFSWLDDFFFFLLKVEIKRWCFLWAQLKAGYWFGWVSLWTFNPRARGSGRFMWFYLVLRVVSPGVIYRPRFALHFIFGGGITGDSVNSAASRSYDAVNLICSSSPHTACQSIICTHDGSALTFNNSVPH